MNVNQKTLKDLAEAVGRTFFAKVEIGKAIIELPEKAFDPAKQQYDAAKVVRFLEGYADKEKAEKVVFVCNFDLFTKGLSFVFGVAKQRGNIALVSLHRLNQKFYEKSEDYGKLLERAIKETIHELGHCFGLQHCKDKSCVMVFSKDIVSVDKKTQYFCEDCRIKIRRTAFCK